jgi:hypothetical protein
VRQERRILPHRILGGGIETYLIEVLAGMLGIEHELIDSADPRAAGLDLRIPKSVTKLI